MASIFDDPPNNVKSDLNALFEALNEQIPEKQTDNLLIATWNIRAFGSLTQKWTAVAGDSPKRDLRGLRTITDILKRFDVIAVQEVKGSISALREAMSFLGNDWAFLMTDVTAGRPGNNERLAFVFNRSRIKPSGLAAEIVVPEERLTTGEPNALTRQFARTPYAVSFQRGEIDIILVTLHVLYGDSGLDRIGELQEIANWMKAWARRRNRFQGNLLTLGDFNIDRQGDAAYEVFTSTGLTVPSELLELPRTIFDDPSDPSANSFYDQIAWFESGGHALINMTVANGGNFDFLPHIYRELNLSKLSMSFRVSDHLPLWIEFQI